MYVVPGVAIGLAIVRIVQFFGGTFVEKTFTDIFQRDAIWLMFWNVFLLGLSVQYWYFTSKKKPKNYMHSFRQYVLIISTPIAISFLSFIISPNNQEAGFKNLSKHWQDQSAFFFLVLGIAFLLIVLENLLAERPDDLSYAKENWIRTLVAACCFFLFVFPRSLSLGASEAIVVSRDMLAFGFLVGFILYRLLMWQKYRR